MKRTTLYLTLTVCASLMIVGVGCEDSPDDVPDTNTFDSADRDTSGSGNVSDGITTIDSSIPPADAALSIAPATVTLEKNGNMASFTASGGSAPYSWSVQDVFRGSVVSSGGSGSAYQRSAAGDNAIIVKDSTGEKVFAIVKQP